MWYHCPCGKVKSGPPYKNSGYRPWMCERCKRASIESHGNEGIPIIKRTHFGGRHLSAAVMVKIQAHVAKR